MKVSSVAQMRNLDRLAMETYGISEELLMENAALAAVDVLTRKETPHARRFLIICGMGNNGGDGLAAGRKLHSLGRDVDLVIIGNPGAYKGAAGLNAGIIKKIGLPLNVIAPESGASGPEGLESEIQRADVVVDALFGTGLSRPVEGVYARVIDMVNGSGKPVVSLDIPSGVNGDTGRIMGCAVRADATVTFGLPKYGNLLFPGAGLCGKLYVSHISFPVSLYAGSDKTADILTATNDPAPLPPRDPAGHKGSFGDALFIAGARGYYGAPYFAAMAMLKGGGGYSRLAAPLSVCEHAAQSGREIVFHPMAETMDGALALSNAPALTELASRTDFVVLGPGLSLGEEPLELARTLVRDIEKPLLIDGDAITAVAADPDILTRRAHPAIVTAHAGEFSRLTGIPVSEVEADRIAALKTALKRFGCAIMLKGAHSLLGFPDGRILINMTGNAGMATAGSGDVLAGVIAAMFGLFSGPEAGRDNDGPAGKAFMNGVFVHGLAGDVAAEQRGEDCITASDILACVPEAVLRLRTGNFKNPVTVL